MKNQSTNPKKDLADKLIKMLVPHMSSQLGANLGLGVNTQGSDLLPQVNEAISLWIKENDARKLIATVMTINALGVITEDQADDMISDIKQIDKNNQK